jgi:lipopolysaccharide export system permease protein
MARLTRYLFTLFFRDTLALFGVAAFILYLVQCLRLFDLVADKGQSLLTLLGQAALAMPGMVMAFLYVCVGIGIGRALRNLQSRNELQIIHVGGLVPALWRAVALYLATGAALVLILAHVVDPLSMRLATNWTAGIAADLVSRALIPHKFVDVAPGVSIVIDSRDSQGNITGFFADDHRQAESRRTYFAKSAVITHDAEGYALRLTEGAVQYMPPNRQLAQVSFERYDLALDRLAGTPGEPASGPVTSVDLVRQAIASGTWSEDLGKRLIRRTAEGVRLIAVGLLVAAVAGFPSGRRGREVPIEIVVFGAAFLERIVSSYLPGSGWLQVGTGSMLLAAIAAAILIIRLGRGRIVREAQA